MRSKHNLSIQVPIPQSLSPAEVVDTLQTYSPMIRHQNLVTKYQRTPVELSAILNDEFFLESGKNISSYRVYERVPIVPGIASKEINFPVIFQSVDGGVRCRADAPAGVRLWSQYLVRQDGTAGYVLVEDIVVESNSMLMPFVYKSMAGAHRELCMKVLEELEQKQKK
jgi:hypothetical protein